MHHKNILPVIIFFISCFLLSTVSAQPDSQKVEAYLSAIESAKAKVKNFKEALRSRDPIKIKKANLEIQADPAAIKELNKEGLSVRKKFVETTEIIQSETLEGIKQRVAEKYNVDPADVEIETFTNPSKTTKGGHDWDVTVKVKGEEVNFRNVKKIVHEAYYDAAGGKKAYPNENPKHFSETHNVEVTSSHSAEAYEGGKKYIDNPGEYQVKDPERLSKTIEHKSHLEQKKAAEFSSEKGGLPQSEVYRHEQARQYTKQYDKHIKKIIQKRGGRIPENVQKGTKILRKIGKFDKNLGRVYTPADADAELAKLGKHGETIESIIQKGSALSESAHKLKAPSKEARLKKKLGHTQEELQNAFNQGNKKGLRKAKQKIARTKYELKQERLKTAAQRESASVGSTSETGVPNEKMPVSGEDGSLMKGAGKVGRGAGKALETAGVGAVIFNTAEDVKESIQGKKPWSETGKNMADAASLGSISTVEQTVEKNKEFNDMLKVSSNAQNKEDEAHVLRMGLALRKSGVPKEKVRKIMQDMRSGDNESLYKQLHELRKKKKIIPLTVPKQVKIEGPDDSYGERARELEKGIVKYGKRAGEFVMQTGRDIKELGKEGAGTVKGYLHAYNTNKKAASQLERMKAKLIEKGATPAQAEIAVRRYADGHKETLDHLIRKLHDKQILEDKEKKKETVDKSEKEQQRKAAEEKDEIQQKQEILDKTKIAQKREEESDIAAKSEAARKRLKEKIDQSKKENIEYPVNGVIANKDGTDGSKKPPYEKMTIDERHKALKNNSDEAWEGLAKELKNDLGIEEATKNLWSGLYIMRFKNSANSESDQGPFAEAIKKLFVNFMGLSLKIKQKDTHINGTVKFLIGNKSDKENPPWPFYGEVDGLSADIHIPDDDNQIQTVKAHLSEDGKKITIFVNGETMVFHRAE